MKAIIFIGVLVLFAAFMVLVSRFFSALSAGRCSECGNFWTTTIEKTSHDDHRSGGRYVYHQCECRRCNHFWGKTAPKFVKDKVDIRRDVTP